MSETHHIAEPSPRIRTLAERIFIAVTSVQQNISYATAEKRMEESGLALDPSWIVIAQVIDEATNAAVSERLLSMFGKPK